MARFDLKFLDRNPNLSDFIQVEKITDDNFIDCIKITGNYENFDFIIELDKSTAIKFAKTLRTEINKITESEVKNG
jgi:hypothetical protein